MTTTGELISAILSGRAPVTVRLAAARGALPLAPEQLLQLQIRLRRDADGSVRAAAAESLHQLPDKALGAICQDPATDRDLLEYLLEERDDLPPVLRRELAAHPAVDPLVLERVAAREQEPEILEALVANQQLLRARPGILEALRGNPALSADLHRRLEDLAEHLPETTAPGMDAEAAAAESTAEPVTPETTPEGIPLASDPRLAAAGIDAEVEAMLPLLNVDVGELLSTSEILGGDELARDVELADAYRRILQLNVAQKLRLALFGTREERNILVRDSNRLVATSVIKNPRISEQEIEIISHSRNVSEEVLQEVLRRKDAMKRYTVVHNLARNPKVPIPVAINLVFRLNDRDLKMLQVNRNVAEAVRMTARKQIAAREQRQKVSSFRKGH